MHVSEGVLRFDDINRSNLVYFIRMVNAFIKVVSIKKNFVTSMRNNCCISVSFDLKIYFALTGLSQLVSKVNVSKM